MTPQEIELVRRSFAKVVPIKDAAGLMFYEQLFSGAPELKPLFKGDIGTQARKLMDTLSVAVASLRDWPALEPTLRDLGGRHRSYGVQPKHYASVGAALIKTLEKGLGATFDAPTRAAWLTLYQKVAQAMEPKTAEAS